MTPAMAQLGGLEGLLGLGRQSTNSVNGARCGALGRSQSLGMSFHASCFLVATRSSWVVLAAC